MKDAPVTSIHAFIIQHWDRFGKPNGFGWATPEAAAKHYASNRGKWADHHSAIMNAATPIEARRPPQADGNPALNVYEAEQEMRALFRFGYDVDTVKDRTRASCKAITGDNTGWSEMTLQRIQDTDKLWPRSFKILRKTI